MMSRKISVLRLLNSSVVEMGKFVRVGMRNVVLNIVMMC